MPESPAKRPPQDAMRATVEEALRRAGDGAETEPARRAAKQRRYLEQLSQRVDVAVLISGEMWRSSQENSRPGDESRAPPKITSGSIPS